MTPPRNCQTVWHKGKNTFFCNMLKTHFPRILLLFLLPPPWESCDTMWPATTWGTAHRTTITLTAVPRSNPAAGIGKQIAWWVQFSFGQDFITYEYWCLVWGAKGLSQLWVVFIKSHNTAASAVIAGTSGGNVLCEWQISGNAHSSTCHVNSFTAVGC